MSRVRDIWWDAEGRLLGPEDFTTTYPWGYTDSALRILQGTGYDPGCTVFRLHTALNQIGPHCSALVRWYHANTACDFRQYNGIDDMHKVRELAESAHVFHCHVNYDLLDGLAKLGFTPRSDQLIIRHYHGSLPNNSWMDHETDAKMDALRMGDRLSHCEEDGAEDVLWLPIPVPVRRYWDMWRAAPVVPLRPFRVAHSPTRRGFKQTDILISAVDKLRAKGFAVELDIIEKVSLHESLLRKTQSHCLYDSMWLGLQTSGLEAGAMGLPVLAGDSVVKELYEREVGYCPYTFVDDEKGIMEAIERLALDEQFYIVEAKRLRQYVLDYHDYASVAKRYDRYVQSYLPFISQC